MTLTKLFSDKENQSGTDEWLPANSSSTRPSPPVDLETIDQPQAPTPVLSEPTRLQWFMFRLSLALETPKEFLRIQTQVETDRGAYFLWAPVFFGLGSVIYFNLPREPLLFAFPVVVLAMTALAVLVAGRHWAGRLFFAIAFVAAGAAVAQFKTNSLDTTMMSRIGIAVIQGQVIKNEMRANATVRYTIDLAQDDTGFVTNRKSTPPKRVRLTARKGSNFIPVGSIITGRARLGPSPGPSFPGAYDFSFQAWFDGIGASGFFLGKPSSVEGVAIQTFSWKLEISKMRSNIAELIREALPGRSGGLAAALIVGDRSGIDDETAEALRQSGLAHILAISGLHMALVAMTVILTLRSAFAFFPKIALYYPVRKWASAGALAAATIYLLLSGANVSTQRAYVMVAIMLVAIMCDRRALTMRNVAIAAFVVLIIAPHAVLTPGFQMSFAAVAALVATYEVLTRRAERKDRVSPAGVIGLVWKFLKRNVGGLALTSLVAGFATGIFAAYHFHRVAVFGLVANLLAMPLVSLAVMPLALASVIAMPFGLEAYPLSLMAIAMDGVVDIANGVATKGPPGNIGIVPVSALLWASIALLIGTLMRSRLKFAAIPFVFLSMMAMQNYQVPDLLIHENGNQVGVVEAPGQLRLLKPNSDKFTTKMWRAAFATPLPKDAKPALRGATGEGFTCDQFGCSTRVEGKIVVHLKSTANIQTDCRLADIIVVRFWLQNACADIPKEKRPIIIDGRSLQRGGSHALSVGEKVTVTTSYSGKPRPWNRHRAN